MFKKTRIKLSLKLLVAVAALGLAFLALRPREPAYQGKPLTTWFDEFNKFRAVQETFPPPVRSSEDAITNAVRAVGSKAAMVAVGWIRDKPRISLYDKIQYRIENAFSARIHLPERNDRSGDAIWVFQILGPEAEPAIPDLAKLALSEHTCYEAAHCLSMTGPAAVPALSNAVASGTARVRLAAIDALAQVGHSAAPTAPLLQQLIRTNDPSTWEALRALVEVETNTAGLLPVALRYLQDTPPPPSNTDFFGAAPGAAYAVARIGPEGTAALLESLTSTQAAVRACARAAFDPRFQNTLTGKLPSDFYARSGLFESVFNREMILDATANTAGQYPDTYYQNLIAIANRYNSSTNTAIRSAAEKLILYATNAKAHPL